MVRGFQENLVAKRPSGLYGIAAADQAELRNRRWWPSRSAGLFTTPPCIYAERASLILLRHPHALAHSILLAEMGATGKGRRMITESVCDHLVELGYLATDRPRRALEYRLLRPYKAPLYRPNTDQLPWWEVMEEPERAIITIGMATAHGPEHWRAG